MQARAFRGKSGQIDSTAPFGDGDFDRLDHLRQHLAVSIFGQHSLHRQIRIRSAIDAILFESGQGDPLGHVQHQLAGVLDAQITFNDQLLGFDHQLGITQIHHAGAIRLDHDRVTHQAQSAQGLVPFDVFDARDQASMAQSHHVLGDGPVHRLEAQSQAVIGQLAGARVHILKLERSRQTIGSHCVAQIHDDVVGPFGGAHHQGRIGQTHHRQLVGQQAQTHLIQGTAVQAQGIATVGQNFEVACVVRSFQSHHLLYLKRHLTHRGVHAVAERHHQRASNPFCTRCKLQIARRIGQEAGQLGHSPRELHARSRGVDSDSQKSGICRRNPKSALSHIQLHRHHRGVVTTDRRFEQVSVVQGTQRENQRCVFITGHHQHLGQQQIQGCRRCRRGKLQHRMVSGHRRHNTRVTVDAGPYPSAALGDTHFAAAGRLHPGRAQIAGHPNSAVVA